nr:hypothetical protein [Tanacetum cinerariifolium]
MDSIISLGQNNTLAEYMILSGADNRLPMLDKDLYDSWKNQMELYMKNREHGRMIPESVEHDPLIWPTVKANGRTKKYAKLSAAEKIQADCDMKATNIIFQGLPADIYSLVNYHIVAKDLYERVQLLMQASSRFPSTNNQLKTFSNTRNQATIQDGRVTVQQVQRRQGKNYFGTTSKGNATSSRGNTTSGQARVVKYYNCQGERHMARQCTQPKRPRNAAWFKEKAMLGKAQEAGHILDEKISILMILIVMISRLHKRFLWPTFPTMVLTLSQRLSRLYSGFGGGGRGGCDGGRGSGSGRSDSGSSGSRLALSYSLFTGSRRLNLRILLSLFLDLLRHPSKEMVCFISIGFVRLKGHAFGGFGFKY